MVHLAFLFAPVFGLGLIAIAIPAVAQTQARGQTQAQTQTQSQTCHPSYLGACLPLNGPDVDCANGSGDGPLYVEGPIQVVGPDPYRLDRDGDGRACERR